MLYNIAHERIARNIFTILHNINVAHTIDWCYILLHFSYTIVCACCALACYCVLCEHRTVPFFRSALVCTYIWVQIYSVLRSEPLINQSINQFYFANDGKETGTWVTKIQIMWVKINQIRLINPLEIQTVQHKEYLKWTNELG